MVSASVQKKLPGPAYCPESVEETRAEICSRLFLPAEEGFRVDWQYLARLHRLKQAERDSRYDLAVKLLYLRRVITREDQGYYIKIDGVPIDLEEPDRGPKLTYFLKERDADDYVNALHPRCNGGIYTIKIKKKEEHVVYDSDDLVTNPSSRNRTVIRDFGIHRTQSDPSDARISSKHNRDLREFLR